MKPANKSLVIGLGGFFVGALAFHLLDLPPVGRAALTFGAALATSLVLWLLLRFTSS